MTAPEKPDQQDSVIVSRADLPAYCPTESMGLWNSHPRVYIPLEETDTADCPYCGTRFIRSDAKDQAAAVTAAVPR